MSFDYTPLRLALKKMHERMQHGTWQYISRQTGISGSGIQRIAYGTRKVSNESWEKLYAAFPEEIPAPPWYQSGVGQKLLNKSKLPELAARLKQARESAGLSIDRAARDLDTDPKNIESWENGQYDPPIDMLVKITDLYNIDAHRLLTGQPMPVGLTDAVMAVMKSEPDRHWTAEDITEAINDLIKSGHIKMKLT